MRRSRERASLAVVLLAATAFAGCRALPGGDGAEHGGDARLHEILDRGKLRVAVSADRPPLNLKNRDGQIVGLEIDIVQALAEAMSLELELVVVPFPDLLESLERGDADLAISNITMTPKRNVRVAFAGPYFVSGMSVLSRSQEITDAKDLEALDLPARRYAAVEESTSARFVGELIPRAQLVKVSDYDAGIQMVIDGRVDALFADYLACVVAVWRYPDAGLSARSPPFTIEPLGIAVPPDAPLLLNLVENYLETLDHTGILGLFEAKWLDDGSWLADLP